MSGSRLLFPTLSKPTAPVEQAVSDARAKSTLTMPKRQRTRAQDRAQRVDAERKINADALRAQQSR